jgi:hypothetical protein
MSRPDCARRRRYPDPALSLAEREGTIPIPSPPEGERDRVSGAYDAHGTFMNDVP